MLLKRVTGGLCAAAIMLSVTTALPASASDFPSASEIVGDMGIGWNLGNSLDATGLTTLDSETYWGNPKTSKELIKAVKSYGFNTVRVPVSWGGHMDSNGNIDSAWMNRVKEVVDYAYDEGMYVIVNIHHDNDIRYDSQNFFYPSSDYKATSVAFVTNVWSQVSGTFSGYDEHLIFETLNEPRLIGNNYEWWFVRDWPADEVKDALNTINELNQTAVNTIRASGGNNAKRLILCPGYDASLDGAMNSYFSLPYDSAGMTGVSIHAYSPYNFAMKTDSSSGATSTYSDSLRTELAGYFNEIKNRYTSQGIPAVMTEFGAVDKNNQSERMKWAEDYTNMAGDIGMPVVLWDNNAFLSSWDTSSNEKLGFIDRSTLTVRDEAYWDSLTHAARHGWHHAWDKSVASYSQTYTCILCGATYTGLYPNGAPLSITTQPTDCVVANQGDKARFTVTADGTGLSYAWYYRASDSDPWTKTSNTTNTYAIEVTPARNARQMYCQVTDSSGNTVNTNVVTMSIAAAAIKTQPTSVSVANEGDTATFKAAGTGINIKYAWYYRDSSSEAWKKTAVTSGTYSIAVTKARDGRQMYCQISDGYGNVRSTNTVTMSIAPVTIATQPKSVTVTNEGDTAAFTVAAKGSGLTYKWYYRASASDQWKETAVTKNSYSIAVTKARDGRQMKCVVTDSKGNSVGSNVVTMSIAAAAIKTQPASVKVAKTGDTATFSLTATGSGLTYAWYYRDSSSAAWKKTAVTKNTYSIAVTSARNGRQMKCIVTDSKGNTAESNVVTMSIG